jgi:hypothetical protein
MAQQISHRPEEDHTEEEEDEPLTLKEYADDKCLSEYDHEDHTECCPYPSHPHSIDPPVETHHDQVSSSDS